ncbi:MAG: hypothetical protein ABJG75_12125 [Roseobacter sp.]
MKNTITLSTSVSVLLTILHELFGYRHLPLGGSSMAQLGILCFGFMSVN